MLVSFHVKADMFFGGTTKKLFFGCIAISKNGLR